MIQFDHFEDIAALIAGVIILAGMILWFVRSGGRFKFGKGGAEISEGGEETNEMDEAPICAPYVEEHTRILDEHTAMLTDHGQTMKSMEKNIILLTKIVETQSDDVKALFMVQRSLLSSARAQLEALKGENNGNVDAAIGHIKEAQGKFDDHLMSKVGG